ncbi:uncharacterized protein LOC131936266 [Physella acuta]|uniref:uncharacterized protein LOC131936266 n=1 Tax=Physella acuta TaxID=109671 RepID=UPI0027DE7E1A|nr:uncharacterized protein LOC131936266 [Physella acuta]
MGFHISLSWRILLLLSLCAGPMFGCDVGWFGPFCRLKCHCINNQCDDMGTCLNASRCDVGWFGPLCQYMNLASLEDGVILTPAVPELTDSQNDTCSDIEAFSIIWKQAFELEWIQIISRGRFATPPFVISIASIIHEPK